MFYINYILRKLLSKEKAQKDVFINESLIHTVDNIKRKLINITISLYAELISTHFKGFFFCK